MTNDDLPPVIRYGDIPSYSLDQYTRLGRAAIKSWVQASSDWRAFAGQLDLSFAQQCKAAGELFFRVESAAVTRRTSWDIARVIRDEAWRLGCHIPVPLADHGLALAFREVARLNDCRSEAMSNAAMCSQNIWAADHA